MANNLFENCIKENKKSKYAEASLFYLTLINLHDDYKLAEKYARKYRRIYPSGIYQKRIELNLKQHYSKQKKEKEVK